MLNSLKIGLLTALFGLLLVFSFTRAKYIAILNKSKILEMISAELPVNLTMIVSPLLIGTVLSLLFGEYLDSSPFLLAILSLMNAISFLPSLYRVFSPAFLGTRERFDPLCSSLGMRGWGRWKLIDWPGVRSSIGYGLSICLVFSLGDARGILFFNQSRFPTLITLIYQKMRQYQFQEAASISIWLIFFSVVIYYSSQKIFKKS